MNGASIKIVVNHLPEILLQMHQALAAICEESAQEMIQTYAGTAARDTGFMASSGYVKTAHSSTYGQGAGSGPMLPEVDAPTGTDAYAAVAADYAAYPEFGTVHQAAQPAFVPALDATAPSFEQKLAGLESRIKV